MYYYIVSLSVFILIGVLSIVAGVYTAIESWNNRDEYLPGDITGYLLSGIAVTFGIAVITIVIIYWGILL